MSRRPPALAPGLALEAALRQQARALPGLLHTTALLRLAQSDLVATVDRALAENPMLQRAGGRPCPGCGRHLTGARCPRCRPTTAAGRDGRGLPEPDHRPFEELQALAGCEVRTRARHALPVVLAHLTERGLLDSDPGDIGVQHGLDPADVAEALRAVRAVAPPGTAERTLADALRAQADDLVRRGGAPVWLPRLVAEHLDSVAADRPEPVSEALGVELAAVRAAFVLVRTRLHAPLGPSSGSDPLPPPPDVWVHRGPGGDLIVEVADSRWFGLRTATIGARLRSDPDAVAWLGTHRRAAATLIQQVDARAGALRRVAEHVVRAQRAWFDGNPAGQLDLSRSEVADRLGVHPSTVSRAVAGKVVRTPDARLISLASLFGSGVAARHRIGELLAERPRSDADLAAALAAEGRPLARRTVAKYRAQLGLPATGTVRGTVRGTATGTVIGGSALRSPTADAGPA